MELRAENTAQSVSVGRLPQFRCGSKVLDIALHTFGRTRSPTGKVYSQYSWKLIKCSSVVTAKSRISFKSCVLKQTFCNVSSDRTLLFDNNALRGGIKH